MGPLTLPALLGLAFGVVRALRVPIAQSLFWASTAVILALYVGALAGALWWTALAIHLVGIALLGAEALRHARHRPAALAIPLPIGMLVLLYTWFWIVHGTDEYTGYDEFQHWGVFIKEMLALDGFWTADTNSPHPRYPPGAPLWQYFFNVFLPYSEGNAYLAHFALLLGPLLPLWHNTRWSQPLWPLAILALVALAITNFGLGITTIYVDQTIGVWYLGTLVAAFAEEDLASRRIGLYAAPLTVLALLKDVGLALAASAALIITALFCYRLLVAKRARSAPLTTAAMVALLVPTLLCVQVWSWNRDSAAAAQDVQSIDGFIGGISGQSATDSVFDIEVDRRLREVFFDQQLSNTAVSWDYNEFTYQLRGLFTDSYRLTTFALLVMFVCWWAAISGFGLAQEARVCWLIVAGGVFATALVYVAALHWSYRFTFGARGVELPSYVRYVHVIALPMLLLAFCPLLPAFRERGSTSSRQLHTWPVERRTGIFLGALVALYVFETPYLLPLTRPPAPIPERAAIERTVAQVREQVGDSRLWVHFTRDTQDRLLSRIALYLLAPTPSVVEHSERFLYVNDVTSVATVWSRFDFIWIANALSPEAAAGFARFGTGDATVGLFRVHALENGEISLEPRGVGELYDTKGLRGNAL